jgi:diguanylate cyclase (GGDEF)-like protein/PAS domain S-box-containing protein
VGANRLSLDVQATLLSYPGPALIVDSRLETLSMNKSGEILSHLLNQGDEVSLANVFRDAIREATILDMPTETQIELVDTSPDQVRRFYDISLLPCVSAAAMGNDVLVLARETTVDRSMMAALVRSRELYRDLLRCSSDFAWETDVDGRFEFISERGASGHTAQDLTGMRSEDLLDRSLCEFASDWSPFCVTFPIDKQETWIKGIDGKACCMLISAVPILDEEGHHTGTRGAGVDVTQLRRHEKVQAETERREEIVFALLETIQAEFDPGAMLQIAAREIASAFEADKGCVLSFDENHNPDGQSVWDEATNEFGDEIQDETVQGKIERAAAQELKAMGPSPVASSLEIDGRAVLVCGTLSGNEPNGGIVIVSPARDQGWEDEDRLLMRHVADQMGVIIARAAHARVLESLSRSDPLTHLLNRRAFYSDADLCLARNERSQTTAAYIYFDLDNFKQVNDSLGHGAGDTLLIEFSDVLRAETRRGDLAVRLGGDEFGLLLDNCDEVDAIAKAEAILNAVSGTPESSNVPWDLSVSAGIALWRPGLHLSIEDVMEHADEVLYEAKKTGKNTWCLAPTAAGEVKKTGSTDERAKSVATRKVEE